jgi:hypothetical protein
MTKAMDSLVENAYVYGREWIVSQVRNSVMELDILFLNIYIFHLVTGNVERG